MSQASGPCPVCEKKFQPGDDIVTCPSCGAPYHRACYRNVGHCMFEEKHGPDFEYIPPEDPQDAQLREHAAAGGTASGTLCKVCNTVNDASNIFCERCGAPLHGAAAGHASSASRGTPPFQSAYAYRPVDGVSGEIDGIAKKDWATFIGSSAPVYLARMEQQDARKSKFSFFPSSFFLGTFFFAYRRMWGWMLLALFTFVLLAVPNYLFIFADAGLIEVADSTKNMFDMLSIVATYLSFARRILMGMFSLYLYRRQAAPKIRKVLQQGGLSETERQEQMVHAGSPNVLGVVFLCVLFVLFSCLLYIWAGDQLMAYLYPGMSGMGF